MSAVNVMSLTTSPIDLTGAVFDLLQPSFIMLIFIILLYGMYTILFGLYVYLQVYQQGRMLYYQVSLLLLYLLATASVVLTIIGKNQYDLYILTTAFTQSINIGLVHFTSFVNLDVAVIAIYATANIIAEFLLLYRCYVMWGSSKRVIATPLFISIVNAALALFVVALRKNHLTATGLPKGVTNADAKAAETIEYVFLGMNLMTHLLLTGLIAGRIWWISRMTNQLLNTGSNDKRLNGIAAVILESGLLNPVTIIILLTMTTHGIELEIYVEPLLTVVVGIAPTLILVRTDLGISIEYSSVSENGNLDSHETSSISEMMGNSADDREMDSHEPSYQQLYTGVIVESRDGGIHLGQYRHENDSPKRGLQRQAWRTSRLEPSRPLPQRKNLR